MKKARFLFGDIVVVEGYLIGVVLKTWIHADNSFTYEVYVRSHNRIVEYPEKAIERYRVRHKELDDNELYYQAL